MRHGKLLILLAAIAAPSAAATPVQVSNFDSVELRGGGQVMLRHGAQQRVTLVSGDPAMTRFTVDADGRLRIDACVRSCRDYDLRVEIVTPDIEAVAIRGGGRIASDGRFPRRERLAAAISGGGAIDLASLEANHVAASVSGGGLIRINARENLAANVNGGGAITYLGDPTLVSSVNGGGSVSPAR